MEVKADAHLAECIGQPRRTTNWKSFSRQARSQLSYPTRSFACKPFQAAAIVFHTASAHRHHRVDLAGSSWQGAPGGSRKLRASCKIEAPWAVQRPLAMAESGKRLQRNPEEGFTT